MMNKNDEEEKKKKIRGRENEIAKWQKNSEGERVQVQVGGNTKVTY